PPPGLATPVTAARPAVPISKGPAAEHPAGTPPSLCRRTVGRDARTSRRTARPAPARTRAVSRRCRTRSPRTLPPAPSRRRDQPPVRPSGADGRSWCLLRGQPATSRRQRPPPPSPVPPPLPTVVLEGRRRSCQLLCEGPRVHVRGPPPRELANASHPRRPET